MARTMQDVVEAEVRRRYQEMLAAAGVDRDRASLEVLYLLPPEFVRGYVELFEMALSWGPQSAGDGGKDQGRIKARGKGAATGGKRWHQAHWIVRSELALSAKQRLDRRLNRAVGDALRAARKQSDLERSGSSAARACEECGRKLNAGWVRCPFH